MVWLREPIKAWSDDTRRALEVSSLVLLDKRHPNYWGVVYYRSGRESDFVAIPFGAPGLGQDDKALVWQRGSSLTFQVYSEQSETPRAG